MMGVAVVLSSALIGLETEFGRVPRFIPYFTALEHVFALLFAGEMGVRIYFLGLVGYLCDLPNLFDGFLVMTSLFCLYAVPLLNMGPNSGGFLRSLRMLRMLRVLRVLRIFRLFNDLSIILKAFFKAYTAVMWVGVLVLVLDYVLAVFLTQVVGHNAHMWQGLGEEGDAMEKIDNWFGGIGQSMQTLFVVMTLAEWDDIVFTIMEVYPGFVVFTGAMMYIIVVSYAMVSLVTGIISEKLIAVQHEDERYRLREIEDAKAFLHERVSHVLEEVDSDHSGKLSREEVHTALEDNPQLKTQLAALDIDLDTEGLEGLLNKIIASRNLGKDPELCDQEVPIQVMAEAIMRLNGHASASAVFDLKLQLQFMANTQVELSDKLDRVSDMLDRTLKR